MGVLRVDCPQCGGWGSYRTSSVYVRPKIGGFAGDRLGIGRCEGGPGSSLMLKSPKLQKRARDPEAYFGVDQN